MPERKCPVCEHLKKVHSFNGCEHTDIRVDPRVLKALLNTIAHVAESIWRFK